MSLSRDPIPMLANQSESDRSQVQAASREQQFQALFNRALDAVLIADNDRCYVDANPAASTLLGLSRGEIVGRCIEDFSEPGLASLMEQHWQQFLQAGEQKGEWSLLLPDGTRRDVEFRASANFVPGFHLSILRDITERKEAELMLRKSEAQFRSLVETIPQQVWTAQPDGTLDYVNQRVLEYCGRSFEEMIGQGWQGIVHPDDLAESLARWSMALTTGEPYEVEFRLKQASDQSYRWHLGRALPLRDVEERIIKWFGTNTDITERKQAEEERIRLLAQEQAAHAASEAARTEAEAASRAKDEFLATLSHELKTPVTVIIGWANLLHEGKLSATDATRALESIERSAATQARLVDDMLDVSRAITGKLRLDVEHLELARLVEAAVDSMRPAVEAKSVDLQVSLDQEARLIVGDRHRLQQVVWNLLLNAVKFTPQGGCIEVRLVKADSTMLIIISDTGAGISPGFLPHVFDHFYQAENTVGQTRQGMGLGLGIVRHLVELHGGTVRAESPGQGQGATFIVSLPIPPSRPASEV